MNYLSADFAEWRSDHMKMMAMMMLVGCSLFLARVADMVLAVSQRLR